MWAPSLIFIYPSFRQTQKESKPGQFVHRPRNLFSNSDMPRELRYLGGRWQASPLWKQILPDSLVGLKHSRVRERDAMQSINFSNTDLSLCSYPCGSDTGMTKSALLLYRLPASLQCTSSSITSTLKQKKKTKWGNNFLQQLWPGGDFSPIVFEHCHYFYFFKPCNFTEMQVPKMLFQLNTLSTLSIQAL